MTDKPIKKPDQQPACTRVLITAMYSDGSSVVLDIKDPANFDLVEDASYDMYGETPTRFKLEATVAKDRPVILSVYPIPEENPNGLEVHP